MNIINFEKIFDDLNNPDYTMENAILDNCKCESKEDIIRFLNEFQDWLYCYKMRDLYNDLYNERFNGGYAVGVEKEYRNLSNETIIKNYKKFNKIYELKFV